MGKYAISLTGGGNTKSHSIAANGGRNTSNYKIHPKLNSFAEIQAVVRAGLAKKYFDIGQELMTHYTYEGTVYDMPWVVLDNDRLCEWPDGTKHPGLWIGSKYATIEDIQFDAPEHTLTIDETAREGIYYCGRNENIYTMLKLNAGDAIPYRSYQEVYCGIFNNTEIYRAGYGRYLHSACRQWLNSAGSNINEWWTSQHYGDCPPDMPLNTKGFMAGLDSDFLAVVNPVKIQVATNTITDGGVTDTMYDKFFLQSIEELYGSPQNNDVEGPFFPYWKQITGLENPTNGSARDTNDARKIRKLNNQSGGDVTARLRSADRDSLHFAWYVAQSGFLNKAGATAISATLPAGVIS